MNQTMQTILSRRSVRKFTERSISEEILKDLVDAAMHAPSGMCKKTWKFTVIENREIINRLAAIIAKKLQREGYDMYSPTVLIIPSNNRDNVHGKDDNACALQNIFIAAKSYDVGSVWINQLQGICDDIEVRAFLKEIGIPDDHIVYGMAALGYAHPEAQPKYRNIGEVAFIK